MSLKSIRESYSKLLSVLNEGGVALNESTKSSLDTFVIALESTMSKQRQDAIRMTKKAVTERLEKGYRTVFESIMKNMQENAELASKIQNKITSINESKKVAKSVDNYLSLYVESVLPKKTIIDYDRMEKLEQIHESLKDMLLVNDESVAAKKAQLDESFKAEKGKLETRVAKIQAQLNESMAKTQEMKAKLDQFKALELLESKTKELPAFQARQMKKHFAESTVAEIEKNYDKVLESVKDEEKEAAQNAQTTLEAEINKIVDEDSLEEDDLLKNRPHNNHIPENEDSTVDEEFETTETVKLNEEGEVELDESEKIDTDLMKLWCAQSIEVN